MTDKEVLKMLKALKYSKSIIENHVSNMQKRQQQQSKKTNTKGDI
tara:strand:+ start:43 stop:177 length:135 start_codon:yes stop_codon:yes gene_type:complete